MGLGARRIPEHPCPMRADAILTLSCPDRPGIVAAVSQVLFEHGANIEESQQFDDDRTGTFFMRIAFSTAEGGPSVQEWRGLIAPVAEIWIIPYARSDAGAAALEPLLGEGTARGIALVFLCAGALMILAAALAFLTPVYRRVSAEYACAAAEDRARGERGEVPEMSP